MHCLHSLIVAMKALCVTDFVKHSINVDLQHLHVQRSQLWYL